MTSSDFGVRGCSLILVVASALLITPVASQGLPEIDPSRGTILADRLWASSVPEGGLANTTIFGVILDEGRLRFHGFTFNPMSGIDDCRLVGDEPLASIESSLAEGVPAYCKLVGTWRQETESERHFVFKIARCLWVRTRQEIQRLHQRQQVLHRELLAKLDTGKGDGVEALITRCGKLEKEWPTDDGRLLLVAAALQRDPPEEVSDDAYAAFLEEVIAQRHLYLGGPAGRLARSMFWARVAALPEAVKGLLEERLCRSDPGPWCPYKSRKIVPGRPPLSWKAEGALRLAEVLSRFGGERSLVAIRRWRRELIEEGRAHSSYKLKAKAQMDYFLARIRDRQDGR